MFPLNQWYVAGFTWELEDKPLARTYLGQPVVLFRTGSGAVAALEDRCCHRNLPLSSGMLDEGGIRCGYHGLLYAPNGRCIEIPGQEKIPVKACVRAYRVEVRNQIIWIWMGQSDGAGAITEPIGAPPEVPTHDDPRYQFKGGTYHYDAPYQLIHDNLLDLSHVGYVHSKTIGGNPKAHMEASNAVTSDAESVRVVRFLKASEPPATYLAVWPFKGKVDRWMEIDFHVSHLNIFTGAVDVDTESLEDPRRGGLHIRGFHGVTPETATTSHYFWTIAKSFHPDKPDSLEALYQQTAMTFLEDKTIIEAQYRNMCQFGEGPMIDIHVDVGPNRARRIIKARSEGDKTIT